MAACGSGVNVIVSIKGAHMSWGNLIFGIGMHVFGLIVIIVELMRAKP